MIRLTLTLVLMLASVIQAATVPFAEPNTSGYSVGDTSTMPNGKKVVVVERNGILAWDLVSETPVVVVDGLASTSAVAALSANQGRIIAEAVGEIENWHKYVLKPTGVAATDTANFAAKIDAMPAEGGTLKILSGTLKLNGSIAAYKQITKPVFIQGEPDMSTRIEFANDYTIVWGSFTHPFTASTPATWSGNSATAMTLVDKPSVFLAAGDWVIVWSDDDIPNVDPHKTYQRPGELHRVGFVENQGKAVAAASVNISTDTIALPRTVTIASLTGTNGATDTVFTSTAHGLVNGDLVRIASTGSLPGGTSATRDYLVSGATADTFKLAYYPGSSILPVSSAGSGTITVSLQLSDGTPVQVSTSGTLPIGLAADTTYYVVSSSATGIKVSATPGGSAINLETQGSGTHTVTYQKAYLSDTMKFSMTTNPKIAKVSLMKGCGMENVVLGSDGSLTDANTTKALDFQYCLGPRVQNVLVDETHAGAIQFDYSADIYVSRYNSLGQQDVVYGCLVGTVNGFTWVDSEFKECRHVFTTFGTESGDIRWGGPLNARLHNIVASCANPTTSGVAVFDTHPEGYGTTFSRLKVYGGRIGVNFYAFNDRATNTVIDDCYFDGGGTSMGYGINVLGTGTQILRSDFTNTLGAVRHSTWTDGDGIVFVGNRVSNCIGTAVSLLQGTGHQVLNNDLSKSNNPASTYRTIRVDQAPSGTWPDHVDFSGNHVRGFTSGQLGIYGETGDGTYTSTPGPSMQTEYVDSNYGD